MKARPNPFNYPEPAAMLATVDPPSPDQMASSGLVDLPPWNFPPEDSLFFDRVGVVAMPLVGVTAQIVFFAMPAGYTGIVKWLSNIFLGAGFIDGSGDLLWQILRDAQPVEDYEAITAQLGTLPIPTDTFIPVGENMTVSITIRNVGFLGGGASSGGRLKGWRWPTTRRLR